MNMTGMKRTLVAMATAGTLAAGLMTPADAAVAKSATASWTGDAGQFVTIGSKTLGCLGCTRATLTLVSGPKELDATKGTRKVRDAAGNARSRVTYRMTSDIAGVYVYDLKVWPGLNGLPTFTTRWTLTFRGAPDLSLPNQTYSLVQSGQGMTLQDIKVRTNSNGARSYAVLAEENTAGCSIVAESSRLRFARVGRCKVRVTVAPEGIYTAASTVATINVVSSFGYTVTVYGWVQRTKSTANDRALSRARAVAVRNYLATQGVRVSKFNVVQGRGVLSSSDAARRAWVKISWNGTTAGSRSTTVYFAPMSSRLSVTAKNSLRLLWKRVPRS